MDQPTPPDDQTGWSAVGKAMGWAWEMVATTLAGALLGWLLDRAIGTVFVFLMVGVFAGALGGTWRMFRKWSRTK